MILTGNNYYDTQMIHTGNDYHSMHCKLHCFGQMGTNMGAVPRLSEKWTNLPTVRLTNKGALDKKKRQ